MIQNFKALKHPMTIMMVKLILALSVVFYLAPNQTILRVLLIGYHFNWLKGLWLLALLVIAISAWHRYRWLAKLSWLVMVLSILLDANIGWMNGLVINVMITALTIPTTLGIALGLALGKHQQTLYALRWLCYAYVTLIRGVPLIGIMYFVLTLGGDLLPVNWDWPKMVTLWLVYTIFASAYLAEVFRPSLALVTKQYYETAMVLGLSDLQCFKQIIVPKVLLDTMPAAFNIYIGLFKETSLVLLMGYFDILNLAMQYLDEPTHYQESMPVYFMVLVLFWIIATGMHQWSRLQFSHHQALQGGST